MVLVERVKSAQLDSVLTLYDQYDRPRVTRPSAVNSGRVLEEIEAAGGAVFGVFVSGVCIASASLNICPSLNWSARPYGVIENVIVDRDHRRGGLGRAVLDAAVERARATGCYKVMLLTGSGSPAVLNFYSAVGFSATKQGFQIRF